MVAPAAKLLAPSAFTLLMSASDFSCTLSLSVAPKVQSDARMRDVPSIPALSSATVGAEGLEGAVVRIVTLRWPSASERANAMSVLLVPGGRGLVGHRGGAQVCAERGDGGLGV